MTSTYYQTKSRRRIGRFWGNIRKRFDLFLSRFLPKGLYARALIIIIAPIVLLQTVLTFVFMERHWEKVTTRLSTATSQDVAMIVSLYEKSDRSLAQRKQLSDMARANLGLSVRFLKKGALPPEIPRPFFGVLDQTLSSELGKRLPHPFWIDTVGQSKIVEIRVQLNDTIIGFFASRSQTHASNSHIFIVWMFGASLVLITVAVLFMRNQIKPILRLANAAKQFGMGRPAPKDYKITGAQEVRVASQAFIDMRNRIERHVEQRTTMLAGVSHDLRTILTRFKFQLAMLKESPETAAMQSDILEMQHMLEDYLAFTKGDNGEATAPTDIMILLQTILSDAKVLNKNIVLETGNFELIIPLRRNSFKRTLFNLVTNAARYADNIIISVDIQDEWLHIFIDDDGPGIPEQHRENVFKPFYRIDQSRNQNMGNTGLGLSIARDIAQAHGGDIILENSPAGGLRAIVKIPI